MEELFFSDARREIFKQHETKQKIEVQKRKLLD